MAEEHKIEKKDEGVIRVPKGAFYVIAFIVIFVVGFWIGRITSGPTAGVIGGGASPSGGDGGSIPSGGSGGKVSVSADDDPLLGNANAKVTIIEFSDFQCPFCRRHYTQTLPQLKKEYIETGKVKYVYRDFPLTQIHPAAVPAAEAAECADEQGKFWELHDKIFDEQNKQGVGTVQFGIEDVKKWASEVQGLDVAKLNQCLDSGKYTQEVQKDLADGLQAGVGGTPTFYINGRELVGAQPFSAFKSTIDAELAA